MYGTSFKDVCPVQKSLRERRSRHGENHEARFVPVLPVLCSVVINVCRVHFVVTHMPPDEISVDVLTFI